MSEQRHHAQREVYSVIFFSFFCCWFCIYHILKWNSNCLCFCSWWIVRTIRTIYIYTYTKRRLSFFEGIDPFSVVIQHCCESVYYDDKYTIWLYMSIMCLATKSILDDINLDICGQSTILRLRRYWLVKILV